MYDESSGYYYDATSQLYYDVNSQYYYNSVTNKYMYWSADHSTFLPAPDEQKTDPKDEERNKKDAKSGKVKEIKTLLIKSLGIFMHGEHKKV